MARAVEVASEPLGALHLGVFSAGTGAGGPITMVPLEEWRRVMSINLDGTFLCIKHAGAAMVAAGGGAMVAISSIAAPLTHRMMTPYCVSKAALEALVQGAADELGASNVRVNAVRPAGATDLAPRSPATRARREYIDRFRWAVATSRTSPPRSLLLGPESAWVTGTASYRRRPHPAAARTSRAQIAR